MDTHRPPSALRVAVFANEAAGGTLLAGRSGASIGVAVVTTALLASWIVSRRFCHDVIVRETRNAVPRISAPHAVPKVGLESNYTLKPRTLEEFWAFMRAG